MEDAVTINPIPARAYRKSQPMHAGGAPTAPRRFACTVLNLSIYFCLALCFLRSRSHKLFKTPKILKIYFENIFLRWFFEKKMKIFENLKIFGHFSRKIEKLKIFEKKYVFSDFRENFNIFDFSRKKFEIFSFSKIFKKIFFRKIGVKKYFRNGFSNFWVFWKAYDFYFAKNTTRGKIRWTNLKLYMQNVWARWGLLPRALAAISGMRGLGSDLLSRHPPYIHDAKHIWWEK